MKNLLCLCLIQAVFSCSTYDYVIESDYSYNGKFHRYRTFDFALNQSFAGALEDKTIIEKSLKNTLQAWGYRQKEKRPDIVVVYSIYFDDLNLRGYSQPQFQAWLRQNFSEDKISFKMDSLSDEPDQLRKHQREKEEYEKIKYNLKEGTILISFLDHKKNETVWQGYASGIFGTEQEQNERILRSAVIQILDEYRILAFKQNS